MDEEELSLGLQRFRTTIRLLILMRTRGGDRIKRSRVRKGEEEGVKIKGKKRVGPKNIAGSKTEKSRVKEVYEIKRKRNQESVWGHAQ